MVSVGIGTVQGSRHPLGPSWNIPVDKKGLLYSDLFAHVGFPTGTGRLYRSRRLLLCLENCK